MDILVCFINFNKCNIHRSKLYKWNISGNLLQNKKINFADWLNLRFIPDNSNILDLGCGKGILVKQLQNYNSYVGVDINIYDNKINNKLEFIRENCSNFIKKDLTEYNIFVLIDLLHHIDKDEQYKLVYTLARKMKREIHLL